MRSRILFTVLLAISIAALGTAIVAAAEEAKAEAEPVQVTIQGEVLDLACYLGHEAKGADHAGCAQHCVKGGQPMGLLATDGTVYLLFASHKDGSAFESAKDQAGKRVEVAGTAATRGGVKAIEVRAVRAL